MTGASSGRPSLGTVISVFALGFSAISLWVTTLKQPEVSVFVPAVVQYAAPYNNSNFEVIAVPLTLVNDGARTGTVLGMTLAVTHPKTGDTKRFYAADFGRWSMDRTRSGAYTPFAPISLAGRSSRSESVLFYTRGETEKPQQIVRDLGAYRFQLTIELAEAGPSATGILDSVPVPGLLRTPAPAPITFERELRFYDDRAFNSGTIPMYDRAFHPAQATAPK